MSGIKVLKRIRSAEPAPAVIVITAVREVKTAVEAMQLGTFDYLKKPFAMEELRKCAAGKRSETIHSSTSRSVLNQQVEKPTS
jgi:DNA-binding NtrC family response regulator